MNTSEDNVGEINPGDYKYFHDSVQALIIVLIICAFLMLGANVFLCISVKSRTDPK